MLGTHISANSGSTDKMHRTTPRVFCLVQKDAISRCMRSACSRAPLSARRALAPGIQTHAVYRLPSAAAPRLPRPSPAARTVQCLCRLPRKSQLKNCAACRKPNEHNRDHTQKRHTQCRLRNRCRLQLQKPLCFFLRHAPRLCRLFCCCGAGALCICSSLRR